MLSCLGHKLYNLQPSIMLKCLNTTNAMNVFHISLGKVFKPHFLLKTGYGKSAFQTPEICQQMKVRMGNEHMENNKKRNTNL